MNIYLEIFGYIGTALVIFSMMMTSVVKLRIFNMCGGLISLVYAICVNTWPVVVLNACLISINLVQTVRQLRGKEEITLLSAKADDPTVRYLWGVWQKDIEKYHPDCKLQAMKEEDVHILYVGESAIGFFVASYGDGQTQSEVLYLTPAHHTAAMKKRVLQCLQNRFDIRNR